MTKQQYNCGNYPGCGHDTCSASPMDLVELLGELPDHWSLMHVTRFSAPDYWRLYDNHKNQIDDDNDLEELLRRNFGGDRNR